MSKIRGIVNSTDSNIRIHNEAIMAAKQAAKDYMDKQGEPMYCGFAWVEVSVTRTNSQEAKQLTSIGFKPSYRGRAMQLADPAQHRGQSMDCKEVGASAYAEVLNKYGFDAHMGSRAD
jgi:hypothetical protein